MIIWWTFALLVSLGLVLFHGSMNSAWIEAIGLISATICVWDAAGNRERNWPIGVISCVAFFIIFAQAKLYGNMVLQAIYIVQAVWGQALWHYGGERRSVLHINALPSLTRVQYLAIFTTTTVVCTGVLTALNGTAPFWDTFTAVLSIIANQLLVRRRVENWYLWIAVDVVSVLLFASQGLWITTATYVLYLIISTAKAIPVWRKRALT